MSTIKERNETIDVIKGIGILLMVMRHARFPHSDIVLLFHMAVFFIASGYLYKPFDKSTRISSYIFRKIKSLWKPYFITNIIFVMLNNWFLKSGIYLCSKNQEMNEFALSEYFTVKDYIKSLLKAVCFQLNTHMGGATWFYGTLFGVLVLYAVIDYMILHKGLPFNAKIVRVSIAFAFSIFGCLCMLTGHSLKGMDRVFTVYPLIEIGHFFREHDILRVLKCTQKLQAASVSIVILAIGYQFGNIALVNNSIVNPVFFLLMSIAGWFVLLYFSIIFPD